MAQKLITASDGVRAQIFHDDDKGLRAVTLLRSSGPRGNCLYVTVFTPEGGRKALTSYSLANNVDFMVQWARAVAKVADYYHVPKDGDLYGEMLEGWREFLDRYSISLEPITTYHAVIPTIQTEA